MASKEAKEHSYVTLKRRNFLALLGATVVGTAVAESLLSKVIRLDFYFDKTPADNGIYDDTSNKKLIDDALDFMVKYDTKVPQDELYGHEFPSSGQIGGFLKERIRGDNLLLTTSDQSENLVRLDEDNAKLSISADYPKFPMAEKALDIYYRGLSYYIPFEEWTDPMKKVNIPTIGEILLAREYFKRNYKLIGSGVVDTLVQSYNTSVMNKDQALWEKSLSRFYYPSRQG